GGHGSTVNFNYRRWSSASSSSVPPLSSELIKEEEQLHNNIDDAEVDKSIIIEALHVFQDEPEKFGKFMVLLLDSHAGRIDLSVVKEGMTELLKGHNSLIWKFNKMLPPEETPLPLDDDGLPFKYDSAAFRGDQE
ncbi:paired amphipathic helix protein Sin3, partial [Trifolium medium]|nr:paired amphipathic helix protein Sin3 [Trifolium medium]